MNLDNLTLGEIKEISSLLGKQNTSCTKPLTKIGDKVFIRTLTYHYIGEVVEETAEAIILDKTVWVADSGRFTEAIAEGSLNEFEIIGLITPIIKNNMVDIIPWNHDIPTQRK